MTLKQNRYNRVAARYSVLAAKLLILAASALLLALPNTPHKLPPNKLASYSANQVLGQPDFTSYAQNAGQGVNANGLAVDQAVALDAVHHRLFVADGGNYRVLVYNMDNSNQLLDTVPDNVLGANDFTSQNCTTLSAAANICQVTSLAYDAVHNRLFVADSSANRLLVFDLAGGITNGMSATYVIGQSSMNPPHVNGCAVFSNVNAANFCNIYGIAISGDGNRLAVADGVNARVLIFDLSGGITNGMAASQVLGQPDFTSSTQLCINTGQAPGASGLCDPRDVAFSSDGNMLFVADASGNARVLIFDLSGGITNGMAASHVLGQTGFTSLVGNCPAGNVYLCSPQYLSYDSQSKLLFVSDELTDRILVYDLNQGVTDGMPAADVIGQPDFNTTGGSCSGSGVTASTFCSLGDTAYDTVSHQLFAADTNNNRVLKFDLPFAIANTSLSDGETGAVYPNQTLRTLYSNGGASFSVSAGSLPTGLTLNSSSGLISGTPTVASDYNFTVQATDGAAETASKAFTVHISSPITITTTSLASGVQTNYYSQTITASDGVAPYTFSVASGSLPAGLTLNVNTGEVSGTPTDSGDFSFDIQVTDNLNETATQTFALHIVAAVNINSGPLLDGLQGYYYSSTLYTTGTPPYSFSIISGGLPDGMSLNSSTGEVYGVPTTPGDFTFDVLVTDANNTSDTASYSLHITAVPLAISTTTLSDATINTIYSQSLSAIGGTQPYSWAVLSGSLPSGLSLDTSTGEITGTPSIGGDSTFTLQVTDADSATATQDFTLHVIIPPPSATGSYRASDLLGQIDSMGNPVWTARNRYGNLNGGNPDAAGMNYPQGTVMDTVRHRLFVSTCGNRVMVYNLDANNNLVDRTADYELGQPDMNSDTWNQPLGANTLNCPVGASFDTVHNRLFVPDDGNYRTLVFDFSNGISSGMDASYVLGQPDFVSRTSNVTQNGMGYPYGGSAYDPTTQYFYVSDSQNARILIYDLSGGITNGMNASYVLGQLDFTSSGCNISASGIAYPYGLAIDTVHHRLFVADDSSCPWPGYSARVLIYDTTNLHNGMNASYVLGQPDFTSSTDRSNPVTPTQSNINDPEGLAYDEAHQRLFVYDDNFNRIMVFDLSGGITNGMNATAVIGQPDFATNNYDCVPLQTNLCDAEGQSDYYDVSNNRLYLSDSSDNRVLVYDFIRLNGGQLADGSVGVAYSQTIQSTNSQGTVSYSVVSGNLPAGVVLDASTGLLSGTPTVGGSYTFTVQANDDKGSSGYFTDTKTYTLTVANGTQAGGGNGSSGSGSIVTTVASEIIQGLQNAAQATGENGGGNTSIDLDTTPDFTGSTGEDNAYLAKVSSGFVLHFTLPYVSKSGVTKVGHTITVNGINDSVVDITIASHPIHLSLGVDEQRQVDVDGDGHSDLGIKVENIDGQVASLQIWRILTPVTKHQGAALSPKKNHSGGFWYGAGAIVIVLAGGLYLVRSRRS